MATWLQNAEYLPIFKTFYGEMVAKSVESLLI